MSLPSGLEIMPYQLGQACLAPNFYDSLGELLRILILHDGKLNESSVRFQRVGESGRPGFDGQVVNEASDSKFLPIGNSVWEVTCEVPGLEGKLREDLEKRSTKALSGLLFPVDDGNRSSVAFVLASTSIDEKVRDRWKKPGKKSRITREQIREWESLWQGGMAHYIDGRHLCEWANASTNACLHVRDLLSKFVSWGVPSCVVTADKFIRTKYYVSESFEEQLPVVWASVICAGWKHETDSVFDYLENQGAETGKLCAVDVHCGDRDSLLAFFCGLGAKPNLRVNSWIVTKNSLTELEQLNSLTGQPLVVCACEHEASDFESWASSAGRNLVPVRLRPLQFSGVRTPGRYEQGGGILPPPVVSHALGVHLSKPDFERMIEAACRPVLDSKREVKEKFRRLANDFLQEYLRPGSGGIKLPELAAIRQACSHVGLWNRANLRGEEARE